MSPSLPHSGGKRSPDDVGSEVSMHQVVWKGFINMSGLTKFSTTAYPVAGPVDELDLVMLDTKLLVLFKNKNKINSTFFFQLA